MSVDWQYDIIFSFRVNHPDDRAGRGFRIVPTVACRRQLARYGLIFKPMANGGAVVVEKKVTPGPAGPPQPIRQINEVANFSFLLFLDNPGLLTSTIPFHQSGLPEFIGRSRILYFDNLSTDNRIDLDLNGMPEAGPYGMELAVYELPREGDVSLGDLASLGLNKFEYYADPLTTSIFQVTPIRPGGGTARSWPINANNKRVELELEEGPYLIKQDEEEVFYAAASLLPAGAFGLIHIFKDQDINYDLTIRYDIFFEKA
ncbi:MAG: hypothetical protein J5I94_10600 [Phaeodactylibacter sp.]|nr:hypothetical protein [Phaeodactylibacter sp.]